MCRRKVFAVALFVIAARCNDALLFGNKCNGERYDPDTQVCCKDRLFIKQKNIECCRGKLYDIRAQTCVFGKTLMHDDAGCDGTYYDETEKVCCNNKIYAKLPTQHCCAGKVLYDPTKHDCTFAQILEKKIPSTSPDVPVVECNGERYNPDTHMCCNDRLFLKQKNIECCGGKFYDIRAQTCIWDMLINDDTGCDGTYYDKSDEFCCSNKIYTKLPTQRCCGGTVLYDPTEHECTLFNKLEKIIPGHWSDELPNNGRRVH